MLNREVKERIALNRRRRALNSEIRTILKKLGVSQRVAVLDSPKPPKLRPLWNGRQLTANLPAEANWELLIDHIALDKHPIGPPITTLSVGQVGARERIQDLLVEVAKAGPQAGEPILQPFSQVLPLKD